MNKGRLITLVAVVALAAAWAGMEARRHTPEPADFAAPPTNTGDNVANLLATPLKTPVGETKSLADWKGKILVVNFWATWCPPCREEMPEFSRVQARYAENDVQFVGIAIDEAANVVDYLKSTKVNYPLLIGSAAVLTLTGQLGNQQQGLPYTLIISRDGKLITSHLGRLSEADLTKQLTTLIGP